MIKPRFLVMALAVIAISGPLAAQEADEQWHFL